MVIHERSTGIPRTISVLADNALLTGFAKGQRPISSAIVLEVCKDFDLPGVGDVEAPTAGMSAPHGPQPHSDGRLLSIAPDPAVASMSEEPNAVDVAAESKPLAKNGAVPRRRWFPMFRVE